jgi:hypothetical protein
MLNDDDGVNVGDKMKFEGIWAKFGEVIKFIGKGRALWRLTESHSWQ